MDSVLYITMTKMRLGMFRNGVGEAEGWGGCKCKVGQMPAVTASKNAG